MWCGAFTRRTGSGSAAVPRRVRRGRPLRLRVPCPRSRRRVVWWRTKDGCSRARREGALRPRLRPRHHGAAAGRGVAAEDALLRSADRAAEPGAAPEPAGPALAESVRTERPLAVLILALDASASDQHARAPQRGLIVRELAVRLGDTLGDADRVARLRATSSGCCFPTPTRRSRGRSASAFSAPSSGRSWCSGSRSRSRPASGWRWRRSTGRRRRRS